MKIFIIIESDGDEGQSMTDHTRPWNPRKPTYSGPVEYQNYPAEFEFPSKFPCEVTSPWDYFDSFRPQDYPCEAGDIRKKRIYPSSYIDWVRHLTRTDEQSKFVRSESSTSNFQ